MQEVCPYLAMLCTRGWSQSCWSPPISPVSLLGECIHVLGESVSLVAQTVSTLHHMTLHSVSIHYIVILSNLTTLSHSDFTISSLDCTMHLTVTHVVEVLDQ